MTDCNGHLTPQERAPQASGAGQLPPVCESGGRRGPERPDSGRLPPVDPELFDRARTAVLGSAVQTALTPTIVPGADGRVDAADDRPTGTSQDSDTGAAGPALNYMAVDLRPLAVPLATLQPAPDNARRHSLGRDISALMGSLRRFGQRKPIVAKRSYRGVANAVIAGNGTLEAARRLGWLYLAVAWFEGDDDEARIYALSDNRIAELSSWDAGQLAALQADGVDLLSLWHDDADLADLLGADAPVPTFAPTTAAHRLDQLAGIEDAEVQCPACGHSFLPADGSEGA